MLVLIICNIFINSGKIARSKPVIRRYSATCIESKYKHKYILRGNIFDERHGNDLYKIYIKIT